MEDTTAKTFTWKRSIIVHISTCKRQRAIVLKSRVCLLPILHVSPADQSVQMTLSLFLIAWNVSPNMYVGIRSKSVVTLDMCLYRPLFICFRLNKLLRYDISGGMDWIGSRLLGSKTIKFALCAIGSDEALEQQNRILKVLDWLVGSTQHADTLARFFPTAHSYSWNQKRLSICQDTQLKPQRSTTCTMPRQIDHKKWRHWNFMMRSIELVTRSPLTGNSWLNLQLKRFPAVKYKMWTESITMAQTCQTISQVIDWRMDL